MNVFVTGSSSHFSRVLLPRLCAEPGVDRVTGVDIAAPWFRHPKFTPVRMDIRDPRIADCLAGHDGFVHLAFVVLRGRRSASDMFDINVSGSHKLFHAARAAGATRLVHLSSAAVYGSGLHVAESSPLAPLPGFLYAEHKARLEHMLAIEFPECVRLRPHVMLGPHAQTLLKQIMALPVYPRMTHPLPLLQCVHEDDVAEAVSLALRGAGRGAYNLAVEDTFSYRDLIRARHRLSIALPPRIARGALYCAWRAFGWGGEPAWFDGLMQSLVINSRRAIVELGWRSRHNAASAIAQT